jgi:putative aminopeptidase FrvX
MVIAGSVLEQHLRNLAAQHGISVMAGANYKKAETLNADLTKVEAYGKTEQKAVTALLGRRNDAAHGNYSEYDHKDVHVAMEGIRAFMTRFPA